MSTIEESIDVDVAVRTAYDQWTQFEEFPRFMEGVQSITQITPTRTHWITEIAGVTREFDADITEQEPDQRVAWRSTTGPTHAGAVTFHRLGEGRTRVMLQLDIHPEGITETVGDKLGFVKRRAQGDLERFGAFIESRSSETGAWRGEVRQDTT